MKKDNGDAKSEVATQVTPSPEYYLIEAGNRQVLVDEVNRYLTDGWRLEGGLVAHSIMGITFLFQAVIR